MRDFRLVQVLLVESYLICDVKTVCPKAQSYLTGFVLAKQIKISNSPLVRISLNDRKEAAQCHPPPWPLPNIRLSCDNHLPEGDTGRRSHCYKRASLGKETDCFFKDITTAIESFFPDTTETLSS